MILSFLYDKRNPKYPNEVLAGNYLDDAEAWTDRRPKLSSLLDSIRRCVGREVVHLSYERQGLTPQTRGWHYRDIARELCGAFPTFLELVPTDRLDDTVWEQGNPCERMEGQV